MKDKFERTVNIIANIFPIKWNNIEINSIKYSNVIKGITTNSVVRDEEEKDDEKNLDSCI